MHATHSTPGNGLQSSMLCGKVIPTLERTTCRAIRNVRDRLANGALCCGNILHILNPRSKRLSKPKVQPVTQHSFYKLEKAHALVLANHPCLRPSVSLQP